jgi:hypothetical protein
MDQRKRNDRRGTTGRRAFPFYDSNGDWVPKERRKLADRRMEGVEEAEWLGQLAEPVPSLHTF